MAQLNDLKGKRVQEALDEMIQKSLRQMTAQEGNDAPEALLKCLTVFAGRVDYEAISALKPETLTADDLDDALDVLQKWRFVRYDRGEARYSVDVYHAVCQTGGDAEFAPFLRYQIAHRIPTCPRNEFRVTWLPQA
jgi:hypothetical protein